MQRPGVPCYGNPKWRNFRALTYCYNTILYIYRWRDRRQMKRQLDRLMARHYTITCGSYAEASCVLAGWMDVWLAKLNPSSTTWSLCPHPSSVTSPRPPRHIDPSFPSGGPALQPTFPVLWGKMAFGSVLSVFPDIFRFAWRTNRDNSVDIADRLWRPCHSSGC
jgi:hypothetical protein